MSGYGEGTYGNENYGGSQVAQTHLPEKWIERMCAMLEIPVTHQIVRLFTAWQKAEGGTAKWNPLNTVDHIHSQAHGDWQSSPDYNSTGVCNYNHPWQGILAHVDTFEQPAWANMLVALRQAKANGTTAEEIINQFGSTIKSNWGTSPSLMVQILATLP